MVGSNRFPRIFAEIWFMEKSFTNVLGRKGKILDFEKEKRKLKKFLGFVVISIRISKTFSLHCVLNIQ